jgi:hypothetical protein
MFQRYTTFQDHLQIIDDEFVDNSRIQNVYNAVVDVYEKRKLNVMPNLLSAIKFHSSRYNAAFDARLLQHIIKVCPIPDQYKSGLEKYLILL